MKNLKLSQKMFTDIPEEDLNMIQIQPSYMVTTNKDREMMSQTVNQTRSVSPSKNNKNVAITSNTTMSIIKPVNNNVLEKPKKNVTIKMENAFPPKSF